MSVLLILCPLFCFVWGGVTLEESVLEVGTSNFPVSSETGFGQFPARIRQEVEPNDDDSPPRPRVTKGSKRQRPTYKKMRNVVYKKLSDGELKCDIFIPSGTGPFPAILAVHGGAWRSGTKFTMLRHAWRMVSAGYVVVAIDYRHAPKHKFPAQIHDCKHAVRWMRANADAYKIDAQRLGAFGYSAGGHLVALLGTTSPRDGLEGEVEASLAGFSSRVQCVAAGGAPCEFSWIAPNSNTLVYWLGKSKSASPEVYQLASPTNYVTIDDPPFFLFHGKSDWIVPWESSLKMHRKLLDADLISQHEIAHGNGHMSTFSDMSWVQQVIVFFDAHLKETRPPIRSQLE